MQRELKNGQEEGWVVQMEAESASDESSKSSGAFACCGFASMMVIVVGGVGAMVF